MKSLVWEADDLREGILERGPWEKPIKKTEGTLEKPITIEFLEEEEKMKGTYNAPSRFWSSKFNVKSSRNLG